MPKKNTKEETTSSDSLNFTVGNISDIPKVVRAGRTSRYAPLYERVNSLGKDEMIALPITKYSQVQAFRGKLEESGFNVSVRKVNIGTEKEPKFQLTAYVKHTVEKS